MRILFLILSFGLISSLYAQCSDAGVCSLSGHNMQESEQRNMTAGLDYVFAYSGKDEEINYHTIQLTAGLEVTEGGILNIRVPLFTVQDGPLGSVNGFGDMIVSWSQRILNTDSGDLFAQVGTKWATGDANADPDLPMSYQTGLGTNDILFGAFYQTSNWLFAGGFQWAQDKANNNAQTRLRRGNDVYLKSAYAFVFDEIMLTAELLAIKRLEKSVVTTGGGKTKVEDSDPLQINFGAGIQYPLNETIDLNVKTAFAMLERKNNVDGLTRAITFSIGTAYRF